MSENFQKPPLGVKPHEVSTRDRNIELAVAISKYSEEYYKPGNNKKRDKNILETVKGWAMEIVFNCNSELELIKKKHEL